MTTKQRNKKISFIKNTIQDMGNFHISHVDCADSPIIKSFGKDHNHLIEDFHVDYIEVTTYVHETVTGGYDVNYEDLTDDVLNDVYNVVEQYKNETEKTMDRCKSENF